MMEAIVTLFTFWLANETGLFILVSLITLGEEFCSIEKVNLELLRKNIRSSSWCTMNDIMTLKLLYAEKKLLKDGDVNGNWN
jgi:hypothetical protein